MFDPEKVERPYVKEWVHHAVYVDDYDRLLAMYRKARSALELEYGKGCCDTPYMRNEEA